MRSLSIFASAAALVGGFTTEEWLLVLGLVATVINAVIEYLRIREGKKRAES